MEDAPGAFGLAVINPEGKVRGGCCGVPCCGMTGQQWGRQTPKSHFGLSMCLGISCLQGASMWAGTTSCIFWAVSPQSHLGLCLSLKSHDMASFIPHCFHLSQALAEQQNCSVSRSEWRQPVVGIYFHHSYYLLPLDACHACLPYGSIPNSIPLPCLPNFLTLEDSNLFSFLFFFIKKKTPNKKNLQTYINLAQ